jgi:hypothetical protein
MTGQKAYEVGAAVNNAQFTAERTMEEIAQQLRTTGEEGTVQVQLFDDAGNEITGGIPRGPGPTIRFQKRSVDHSTGAVIWSDFFYIKIFPPDHPVHAKKVLLWRDVNNDCDRTGPGTDDAVTIISYDVDQLEFVKKNGRIQVSIQVTKNVPQKNPVKIRLTTSVVISSYN